MPDVVSISHMHRCTHMYRDGLHSHLLRWVSITPIVSIRKPRIRELRPVTQGVQLVRLGRAQTEQFDPRARALKHDVYTAAHKEAANRLHQRGGTGQPRTRLRKKQAHDNVCNQLSCGGGVGRDSREGRQVSPCRVWDGRGSRAVRRLSKHNSLD